MATTNTRKAIIDWESTLLSISEDLKNRPWMNKRDRLEISARIEGLIRDMMQVRL